MKLTNIKCQQTKPTKKRQKLSDGGGLYLLIMPNGSKYWQLKYRFMGKEKLLSFGIYPRVTLAEAREKREEAKKTLDSGYDPSELKRLEKFDKVKNYENSFETIAREWHSQNKHMWKPKHSANILKRFEANIFPVMGSRPIKLITAPEILAAAERVQDKGNHDLAHRMLQMCGKVFRYAVATGRADRDPVPDLRGALKPVKSEGHAYLTEKELPEFVSLLEKYDTSFKGNILTKLAFKLLILTFVRSGEIRGAKWEEIDFEKAEWRIPAERMKMKQQHIIPLSEQSIKILKEIKSITGKNKFGYLLPSQKNPRTIMSENTFLKAIEIMGYKGRTTGHGFRSTASTILNENGFKPDAIERQLAHCERDQVRAAYNYAEYLEERRKMMQWWSNYIDNIKVTSHDKKDR